MLGMWNNRSFVLETEKPTLNCSATHRSPGPLFSFTVKSNLQAWNRFTLIYSSSWKCGTDWLKVDWCGLVKEKHVFHWWFLLPLIWFSVALSAHWQINRAARLMHLTFCCLCIVVCNKSSGFSSTTWLKQHGQVIHALKPHQQLSWVVNIWLRCHRRDGSVMRELLHVQALRCLFASWAQHVRCSKAASVASDHTHDRRLPVR